LSISVSSNAIFSISPSRDEKRVALAEKAWLDLLCIRGLRGREGIVTEKVCTANL